MDVCVIGLGLMGSALAKRLRNSGYNVILYNRTIDKAYRLADEINAKVAESPRECCNSSDITAIFVADDNALIDVVFPPNGFADSSRDKDIVNMSTVSTAVSERIHRFIEASGGNYVESPVYGSVSEVLEGRLVAIVASNKNINENVKQFLSSISKKIMYVGNIPRAMALKLALNQLNMVIVATLAETLSFLKINEIDYSLLEELVRGTWMEPILDRFMKRALEEHPPRFRIELAAKDLQSFIESARIKKLNTPITAAAMHRYLEATLHNYGDKDYPNITKYIIDTIHKQNTKTKQ
ncbi:MAG: NAD(P)-dependent oxidoreductase [Ignisphaera sp.]|uniref:NAD(P)-dependent oxidoreductase n=1 Tax=Ignisphaera aggregans TaxID=334771 RepID=A0A832APH1_9CREN